MTSDRTALVLGATGGIGGEVARRLVAAGGWAVRALHRNPDRLSASSKPPGVDWRGGDAMSAADVAPAAEGVSVIVHAVNPPGYRNWRELALPILDNTIAAARAPTAPKSSCRALSTISGRTLFRSCVRTRRRTRSP